MALSEKEKSSKIQLVANVFNSELSAKWNTEFDTYDEGWRIIAGEIYTDEQKAYFEPRRRPVNEFSLIFPVYNSILGDFLLSSFIENVYARPGGDPQVAKTLEKVFDNIAMNAEYKYHMGMTLLSGLIKRGFSYPHFSNQMEIDGSILIPNVDEYEIIFDHRAKDIMLRDAKYQIRSNWLCTDDILQRWPHHKTKLTKILRDKKESSFHYAQEAAVQKNMSDRNFVNEIEGQYRVIEFHERSFEPCEVALDTSTGEAEIFDMKGRARDEFLKKNRHIDIIERNDEIIKVNEIIPGLNFYLDERDPAVQDRYFDYVPFSAYGFAKKVIDFFGIHKNAVGPLKDFNDSRNQELNILNKSSNVADIWKLDNIENEKHIRDFAGEPGLQVYADKDADLNEIHKSIDPPKYPFGNAQYSQEGQDLLFKIIAFAENTWGEVQTKNETASLFQLRAQQVQKQLAVIDFNLKHAREIIWNKVVKLIQKNYRDEKFFLITNPAGGDQYEVGLNVQMGEQILNDITIGEYKVIASPEPRNPLMRAANFLKRQEIASLLIKTLGPLSIDWKWLLEDADIGDTTQLMKKIQMVLSQQAGLQERQAAYDDISRLMEAAKQREGSGLPPAAKTAEATPKE